MRMLRSGRLALPFVAVLVAGIAFGQTPASGTHQGSSLELAALSFSDATAHLLRFRDEMMAKAGEASKPTTLPELIGYTGDDTCQWANDGECDDPGLGTGACRQGTDYSDCWRLATDREDDSCQWANDGECDEPHFGTGACTQGTDRTDCGVLALLRFQDDSCRLAFNGVCNEAGAGGDGACPARSDRSDCIGRERPMTINDHYFGFDDRVLMDTTVFPWVAIGTLTAEDGGGCTATLIADDVLITAAHCIETENGIDARAEFATGFGDKINGGSAQVIAYFQAPERANDLRSNEEPAGTDWALLRIDRPLGASVGHIEVRPLVGTWGEQAPLSLTVLQAGYSWDTGYNLSGNLRCSFLAIESENRVIHNCDTTHGDSGSPFLVRDGDTYYIVATDSTFRTEPGQPAVNVATRSDGWTQYVADFIAGRIGETTLVQTTAGGKK